MLPKIKNVKPLQNYFLQIEFDDGYKCIYDVNYDIVNTKGYSDLKDIYKLFDHVQIDESRTCIFWTDNIDLPSDILYEYGKRID